MMVNLLVRIHKADNGFFFQVYKEGNYDDKIQSFICVNDTRYSSHNVIEKILDLFDPNPKDQQEL